MHIAKLQHRVILCSQRDKVADGSFTYERGVVAERWAKIEERSGTGFSPTGASMNETRSKTTHVITMRYDWNLNISLFAWLYEKRLKSSPRWFKVVKVGQTEMAGNQFFRLNCRLVERGDELTQPAAEDFNAAMPLPHGVEL